MKIALINGSPKFKNSASEIILDIVKENISSSEVSNFIFNKPFIDVNTLSSLAEHDIFVIAFPLYFDGVPGHLVNCLHQIEEYFIDKDKKITVYPISNCGFYEATQNHLALDIIKNWCAHCGFVYGQGLGVGAGAMLNFIRSIPNGKGPKKNLGITCQEFSKNILSASCHDNLFTTPNFPRFLYKLSAENNWRKLAKANGVKIKV